MNKPKIIIEPLVWLLSFYICGILIELYLNQIFFVPLISLALWLQFGQKPAFKLRVLPVACVALMLLGAFMTTRAQAVRDMKAEDAAIKSEVVDVYGSIESLTAYPDGDARIILKARDWSRDGSTNGAIVERLEKPLYVSAYLSKDILANAALIDDNQLKVGMGVLLTGKIKKPEPARNPGGFDEQAYFRVKGYSYKIEPNAVSMSRSYNRMLSLSVMQSRIRDFWISAYDKHLPPGYSAIMKAMILGERASMDEGSKQLYRESGVFHIFCISGLHIGMLGLCIGRLLRVFMDRKTAGVVSLALLMFYCLMTGAAISTTRAVMLFGMAVLGDIICKEKRLMSVTLFTMLVFLIINPLSLFDIGFQLSFSAVLGLCMLTKPVEDILMRLRIPSEPRSLLASCIAATLATVPLYAYYFYYIPVYSIPMNLAVLPAVPILAACGFLLPIVPFLSGAVFFILSFYERVAGLILSLPFSQILTGRPAAALVLLLYLTVFCVALVQTLPHIYAQYMRFVAVLTVTALFAAVAVEYRFRLGTSVTALYVGQGDCFVIRSRGRTFVIDGGGEFGRAKNENTGTKVLVPFLDYIGVSSVDGVFMSHMDSDHATGVYELLNEKTVEHLFIPAGETVEQAVPKDTVVSELKRGDSISSGQAIFRVLYPKDHIKGGSENDHSLVLLLAANDFSMLFTGDITEEAEQDIIRLEPRLRVDVLKVAHHGSKYSTSEDFLDTIEPQFAVVSTGRGNMYGFPTREVLDRLSDRNIPLFDTARSGAVTIRVEQNNIKVLTMDSTDKNGWRTLLEGIKK